MLDISMAFQSGWCKSTINLRYFLNRIDVYTNEYLKKETEKKAKRRSEWLIKIDKATISHKNISVGPVAADAMIWTANCLIFAGECYSMRKAHGVQAATSSNVTLWIAMARKKKQQQRAKRRI